MSIPQQSYVFGNHRKKRIILRSIGLLLLYLQQSVANISKSLQFCYFCKKEFYNNVLIY